MQLSVIISDLLEPQISQNLSALTTFSKITCDFVKRKIAKNKIPLEIETPYLTWTYSKQTISTFSRNTITRTSKKESNIKFALFQHEGYNEEQMQTGFASVFLHSCDVFVVQDIINNVNKINIEYHKEDIPELQKKVENVPEIKVTSPDFIRNKYLNMQSILGSLIVYGTIFSLLILTRYPYNLDPNITRSALINNDDDIIQQLYNIKFPLINLHNLNKIKKDILTQIRTYVRAETLLNLVSKEFVESRNITKK